MDEFTRKKRSRTALRTHLKKLRAKIQTILADFDPTNELTIERIHVLHDSYIAQVEKIEKVDELIFDLLTEDNFDAKYSQILTENEEHFTVIRKLKNTIDSITTPSTTTSPLTTHPVTSTPNREFSNVSISSTNHTNLHVKLPKLEIKKFVGDIRNWQAFWDQFESTIHKHEGISDIDKFNYLQSYLINNAGDCIKGLSLTSENYAEAITLLKQRYANEHSLITAHMDSLVKLQRVKSMNNLVELRALHDKLETTIRNLKGLKVETNTYGSLLIPLLIDKLPDEIKIIISRKFGDRVWEMSELLQYFKEELTAKERCAGSSPLNTNKERPYTTTGFFAGNSNRQSCVYCNEPHSSYKCSKVTDCKKRVMILHKKGRCFVCLQSGHLSRDCKSKYSCKKCNKRHNISICDQPPPPHQPPVFNPQQQPPVFNPQQQPPVFNQQQQPPQNQYVNPQILQPPTANQHHVQLSASVDSILLQTGVAVVSAVNNERNNHKARILFDSGAQRSYIRSSLKEHLHLQTIRTERMILNTFGNTDSGIKSVDIVQLQVHTNRKSSIFVELVALPEICLPIPHQHSIASKANYPHLKDLYLSDFITGDLPSEIDVLIGLDHYHKFFTSRTIRGSSGPVALESAIGWVLSGPMSTPSDEHHTTTLLTTHVLHCDFKSEDCDLNKTLHKFWDIESLPDDDDDSVMSNFENDIRFDGNRYITKLPFKDHDLIADNYELSKKRLHSMTKRLQKDPELFMQYDQIFRQYEKEGIVEKVSSNDIAEPGITHYLPHRPVVRQDKETTKVRAVFDASAKSSDNVSLNDCLHSGPNLLHKIFDILMRFRSNKIAIISDIKQAFLNIAVDPEHIDYLRFLWFDDLTAKPPEVIAWRFNTLVFGLTSSPFLLNGTIRHHAFNFDYDIEFITKFIEDLYVDDSLSGADSVQRGFQFYEKAKSLLLQAGMLLRKWCTNNETLQHLIDTEEFKCSNVQSPSYEDDTSYTKYTLPNDGKADHKKVLGINWDIKSDEFLFEFSKIIKLSESLKPTKRNILRVSSSFFDPLGSISPIVIQVKVLFQMLCKEKIDWDIEVPQHVNKCWLDFIQLLKHFHEIRIPRFIFEHLSDSNVTLHGFCDSSELAYSAVVYLRIQHTNGVNVNFLASKTKVAPLNKITIPRLELLSCLLLCNLIKSILSSLKSRFTTNRKICWSDSQIALCWIAGTKKQWKLWVQNGAVTIRHSALEWKHVPDITNPADLPTRNISKDDVNSNSDWFRGPPFLYRNECEWPNFTNASTLPPEAEIELKRTFVNTSVIKKDIDLSNVINFERFSKLDKLIAVTAYVLRFTNNLLSRVREKMVERAGELSVDECWGAEKLLVKHEQGCLRINSKFNCWKKSLRLVEDDEGLIRCGGRLGESDLDYGQKFPVFLRNDSLLTKLLIWRCHDEVKHVGLESTLNRLRCRFWIVRGRQTVKKSLTGCVLCKIHQGKTLLPPSSPELPKYRLVAEYCFQSTGTDFAGPLYVKQIYSSDGTMYKCYISLFTCATSRALHLELTPSTDTPSFIRALKRFMARRGYPDLLVSDNASTFKSVELKDFLRLNNIKKDFILPSSPWWGGFYERLVRIVKSTLKKTIGKARLTYEEMETALIEAEGVINSRPLTYLYDDDFNEPLTPSHLLAGRNMFARSERLPLNFDSNASTLSKRAKHVKTVIDMFWQQFKTSYLNELREHHMYVGKHSKISDGNRLRIGDVVLVKDDKQTGNNWRTAKVEKLVKSTDGKIRGAKLSSIKKLGKRTRCSRPLQKLVPLEVVDVLDNGEESDLDDEESYFEVPIAFIDERNVLVAKRNQKLV